MSQQIFKILHLLAFFNSIFMFSEKVFAMPNKLTLTLFSKHFSEMQSKFVGNRKVIIIINVMVNGLGALSCVDEIN